MAGLSYIGKYLVKKVPQTILLIVALVFVVISTYYQVETPIKMGDSITALSNYSLVESVQSTRAESVKQFNEATHQNLTEAQYIDFLKDMSDEDLAAMISKSGTFDPKEVEAKTGFTIKELLTIFRSISDIAAYAQPVVSPLKGNFLFPIS